MKNNKGFTLVEVLATVTIMVIITLIAVPTSIRFIERGKNQQYEILEDQIISAASKYYVKHKDEGKCIELDVLINDIDEKYVEGTSIIDPRNNDVLTNKVQVTVIGTKITYELVENCS